MITKEHLATLVRRRLGEPMVKTEIHDLQIFDNIDYTRKQYIKWAAGSATQEVFMTLALSGGVTMYNLPSNVTEVLGYSVQAMGSINTLFTVENYLYSMGMFDQLLMRGGGDGYTLVSYHIARQFLDTVHRYVVDAYNFHYHKYTNQLEIQPPPPSSGATTVVSSGGTMMLNTPGYILLRTYQLEGDAEDLYDLPWFLDYVTALCKISLGRVRSKFANYTAVGSNVGLALDGDTLLQEGIAEIEKLDERLRTEECLEGFDISLG